MPALLPKILQWSYSRYRDYVKCPLLAFYKHVRKIKEPAGPAMERGQRVDELCTQYANGTLKKCPDELALFAEKFKELRKFSKRLELQKELAFSADWQPREWFDRDVGLVRVKMDCFYDNGEVRKIIDFKTGKIYPDNIEQLDLYAVAGFATAPDEIEIVEAELWYTDQGLPIGLVTRRYTRSDATRLKKEWAKRTKPMLTDGKFKPTPGNHCRWCFFGQSQKIKGGPGLCKH